MSVRTLLAAVTVFGVVVAGCDYIVPPIEDGTPTPAVASQGWSGIVTGVTETGGALHVDLSIQNNTNDWSAMNVSASKARVTDGAGKTSDCATVFVGTSVFVNDGGWFLPPGFLMKGYTAGTAAKPVTQLLYVECAGVSKGAGQKLTIDYTYITGPFNYYVPSQKYGDTMNLQLDKVVANAKYPLAAKVDGLAISKSDAVIDAINKCTVQMTGVTRTDTGFKFDWQSTNPTQYPAYVHIGIPPVIGSDGIMYGFYESPHLSDAPITPSTGTATWSTTQTAPKDVTGFYLLLPVETQQQKYFVDHVVDITDK